MKLAGIDLAEDDSTESAVAVLSDGEVKSREFDTNEEIVDFLEEEKPALIAVNSPMKDSTGLREGEEELQEEGYVFTAAKDDTRRVRRFQDLKKRLVHRMDADNVPEFIRFSPMITSQELAIEGDDALEAYGVETGDIESTREFDAVLGAVTARFHEQGQSQEMGVVVPESLAREDDS